MNVSSLDQIEVQISIINSSIARYEGMLKTLEKNKNEPDLIKRVKELISHEKSLKRKMIDEYPDYFI